MIDFAKRTLNVQGKEENIVRFEVWFRGPTGITNDLQPLVKMCEENGWNPSVVIIPVPVALSDSGKYEEFPR